MLADSQKRQVILIEPSLTLRSILEVTLTNAGYSSASYAQPGPALVMLRQQEQLARALVVLSEQQMRPGPSGWQVLQILRQREVAPRVLFLLDEPRVLSRIEARVAGACATLAKPFRIQDILQLLYEQTLHA